MPKTAAIVTVEHAQKTAFLAAFAEVGTVKSAAKAAGISRTTHYNWLRDDPAYAVALEQAAADAGDRLEAEAVRRAVEGWDEPVFHRGEVVGYVHKYSDTLLIFALKGAKPEKYKDAGTSVVNVHNDNRSVNVSVPSDDELKDAVGHILGH